MLVGDWNTTAPLPGWSVFIVVITPFVATPTRTFTPTVPLAVVVVGAKPVPVMVVVKPGFVVPTGQQPAIRGDGSAPSPVSTGAALPIPRLCGCDRAFPAGPFVWTV